MSIKCMKLTLNIVAAISGLIAAFLWLKATLVKVPYQETKDVNSWTEAAIISDGTDVIETAREQTRWSKWAAYAASLSALCLLVSLVLPDE